MGTIDKEPTETLRGRTKQPCNTILAIPLKHKGKPQNMQRAKQRIMLTTQPCNQLSACTDMRSTKQQIELQSGSEEVENKC